MSDGYNTIVLEEKGDISVIRFKQSDILDQMNIQEIGEEMYKVVESSPGIKLVVDFRGVEYLSSTALGKLITVKRKVDTGKGKLRLCNIKDSIMEVFSITKLDTIFEIKADLHQAVADF